MQKEMYNALVIKFFSSLGDRNYGEKLCKSKSMLYFEQFFHFYKFRENNLVSRQFNLTTIRFERSLNYSSPFSVMKQL